MHIDNELSMNIWSGTVLIVRLTIATVSAFLV